MKVTYIKTKGFRKFEEEFETKFYDTTIVTGGNTKGKTNILYAIIWAFLGTNITGDDKVYLGNKKANGCYVKLKFIDNKGIEHTLERYKNKFTNENNFLLLDSKKVEQKDIAKYYGDKKLFLSIINPSYFINKSPAEQKELIDKYLPKLDISIVYNKLESNEKAMLEGIPDNMVQYLKELNANKIMYENKIELLRGKIAYAENIANAPVENMQVFEKEEELSLARQELSYLEIDQNKVQREKQQKIVDDLLKQLLDMDSKIKELTDKMVIGKKNYLSIKNQEVAYCPMCEQKIEDVNKKITISKMKNELEEFYNKKNNLENSKKDLQSKIIVEKCKLYSYDNIDNTERNQQIAKVKTQIYTLEQEKLEIEKHNNSIQITQKNIDGAKADISIFEEQIAQCNKILDNIKETKKVAQKLYINYLEEKMKYATQHLKNVNIKYYSVLKDSGEIKDDFIITYNGNDLKTLSRSENIATSLELCNMFNKISKINSPLFIDDSESCADYDFIKNYSNDAQVIIARVEKGQEFEIKNANSVSYLEVA